MNEESKEYAYIPFYALIALAVCVPLAISPYFENPVDLVKSSVFEISGALFIISTLVISMEFFLRNNEKFSLGFNIYLDLPVLFFIIAAIVSTIFSINPLISIWGQYQRQIGLITFIYLLLIYFFSSGLLKDKSRFVMFFYAIELSAVIISIYSCMQMAGMDPFGLQPPDFNRPISTFGNAVFLGGFLTLVLPFSTLNISSKKNKLLRVIFPLIILAGIVISGTRSAYLAVVAEITVFFIVFILLRRKKTEYEYNKTEFKKILKYIIICTVIVIALLAIMLLIFPDSFLTKRLLSIFNSENNPRFILWKDSFGVFKKYPVTGAGIAVFSSAFEEFYSNRLRLLESSAYFDHPHNNYLYMLYSMGILGLVAYLSIIIQSFRICITNIFKNKENGSRIQFTAFLTFLTGYCVYGLTNFDDITMLLYFFIFIAALKSIKPRSTKKIFLNNKLALVLVTPVVLFLTFNIYNSLNDLKADRFFKLGNNLIRQGKFAEAVYNMNTAIALNDRCTDYKYAVAYTVYRQCFSSESMMKENKMNLLNQAAGQIEILKNVHYFKNECDGMLSLIYYEMGREQEAEALEKAVLTKDSVNITYRINLARYYIKKGDFKKAESLMELVLYLRPKTLDAAITAAYLNFKTGNIEKSRFYCEQILIVEPQNQFAIKLLSDMDSLK